MARLIAKNLAFESTLILDRNAPESKRILVFRPQDVQQDLKNEMINALPEVDPDDHPMSSDDDL